MDMFGLSIVSLTKNKLDYLSEKQKVVATNIANANTPGYLAKDVEEPDFSAQVQRSIAASQMTVTNPKHIVSAPSQNSRFRVVTPKPDTALTIDGNGVVLEEQLNEASKTKAEYEKALTIYNKYKSMLQTANTKINT
ncbi:MAG: flagellar biosynthesis protein FlgB [Alphaproteobacteria bacterium]|nr:flagellar biosynthesis protein FlgB [Alphaproteobacteria bacterium]